MMISSVSVAAWLRRCLGAGSEDHISRCLLICPFVHCGARCLLVSSFGVLVLFLGIFVRDAMKSLIGAVEPALYPDLWAVGVRESGR